MVQEFCLGRHPLNEASLQTVVDQCVNFDKDLFLSPVGKDWKVVQTPLAIAAGAAPRDGKNVYEALAAKSFNSLSAKSVLAGEKLIATYSISM